MKRILLLLMLIPLLVITAGLIPSEQAFAQPRQLTAQDVIAEVNALRVSKNLPAYRVNSTLTSIAQAQADHIAGTGVVARFDAGGFSPYQRAIKTGYAVAGDLSTGGLFAENLHSGAVGESSVEVINAWKSNADDLNAMLSPNFTDAGVGLAVANNLTYLVLDVGASTGEPITPIVIASQDTQSALVVISTPLENGDIYHIVQAKEALWSIALAYKTTIEQLKQLNHLASDEIFVGQKLLIQKSEPVTATSTPLVTATFGIPTSTSTKPSTPTVTSTATPLPTPPNSPQSAETTLGVIVLVALIASGLIAWLGKKKND